MGEGYKNQRELHIKDNVLYCFPLHFNAQMECNSVWNDINLLLWTCEPVRLRTIVLLRARPTMTRIQTIAADFKFNILNIIGAVYTYESTAMRFDNHDFPITSPTHYQERFKRTLYRSYQIAFCKLSTYWRKIFNLHTLLTVGFLRGIHNAYHCKQIRLFFKFRNVITYLL